MDMHGVTLTIDTSAGVYKFIIKQTGKAEAMAHVHYLFSCKCRKTNRLLIFHSNWNGWSVGFCFAFLNKHIKIEFGLSVLLSSIQSCWNILILFHWNYIANANPSVCIVVSCLFYDDNGRFIYRRFKRAVFCATCFSCSNSHSINEVASIYARLK